MWQVTSRQSTKQAYKEKPFFQNSLSTSLIPVHDYLFCRLLLMSEMVKESTTYADQIYN